MKKEEDEMKFIAPEMLLLDVEEEILLFSVIDNATEEAGEEQSYESLFGNP